MKLQDRLHNVASRAQDAAELVRLVWLDMTGRLPRANPAGFSSAPNDGGEDPSGEELSGPEMDLFLRSGAWQPGSDLPVTHSMDEDEVPRREETRRKPIVSINGKDVEDGNRDRNAA